MLLRPSRFRRIDPAVRNILVTISVALIGTAVGGVGMLSVVTAVTQPSSSDLHASDSRASDAGAVVAARWPVVITSPHEAQGAGRAPTDQMAAATRGPANAVPQSPKPQTVSPDGLLGGVEAPKAGAQANDQSPAAQTPGSGHEQLGANSSDSRRDAQRAHRSRSKRLAGIGGGTTWNGAAGQPAGNNAAANFAAAQRREMAARPLFDFSGGHNFRDDRYVDPPRPPRGVIMPQDRGFDDGGRFGGWGNSFGGNHWGY
jgi:hypothetical protein